MSVAAENPRAVSGNNNPPVEMTPFDAVRANIDDLFDEAKLWLDGDPITTQEQADALNTLMSRIKDAAKAADEQRILEKKPLDEAVDEIQGRYNPLISGFFSKSKTLGKAAMAIDAAKSVLKPYLEELERQKRETARLAREEADRLAREAQQAMQQRDPANLAQREEAEALVKTAKAAEATASKAENSKAHAKGEGRAVGLRTVWRAHMINQSEAAAWAWKACNAEIMAYVQSLADDAVRAGHRSIRGFEVIEEKVL